MTKVLREEKNLLLSFLGLAAIVLGLMTDFAFDIESGRYVLYLILEFVSIVGISIVMALIFVQQWMMRNTIRSLQKTIRQHCSDLDALFAENNILQERIVQERTILGNLVYRQFSEWGFTQAEKEIGVELLKGKSNKVIAARRNTREHTVRQQETVLYKKCGMHSRSEFLAFFLSMLLDH